MNTDSAVNLEGQEATGGQENPTPAEKTYSQEEVNYLLYSKKGPKFERIAAEKGTSCSQSSF